MQTLSSPRVESPLAFIMKRAGGVIESEISGQSMGSTLAPGTRIRIRCGASADRPLGSVIAFEGYRGLVGHRVVGHVRDRQGRRLLLTRGDGSLICDPPLDPERVLGEVTDYQQGDAWHPLPAAPPAGAARRIAQAAALGCVRAAVMVSPARAALVSEWLGNAVRAFSRITRTG